MTISNRDIKKLYSLSAGRCNICKSELFENNVNIGQMAHIIAKRENGPRGTASLSDRDSYDNLILLCANHHTTVDQDPETYTVDELLKIKKKHECYIRKNIDKLPEKRRDTIALQLLMDYSPFTQLLSHIHTLPTFIDIDYFILGDTFENFKIDCPHMYPFNNNELSKHFDNFLSDYFSLYNLITGRCKYNNREILHFSKTINNRVYKNNQFLPSEYLSNLTNIIKDYSLRFSESYQRILNYLRQNYSEVNLESYNY
nr:HNH endonuclease signature motif containing protein [uncultured Desulfobacter sp.]